MCGGYFQEEGQEKILLCKGGGGGALHEKLEYRGDVFCQLNLINKKGPNAKMHKKAKNYQTLKNFSSLVSLTRHFTKFIILEQLTRHAPVQYAKYVVFFLSLFF